MTAQTGWTAADLHDSARWIRCFSTTELEAVDRAITGARRAARCQTKSGCIG